MKYLKLLILIPLMINLQGCVTAALVGGTAAGVAATSVIYDKRSHSVAEKDHQIRKAIIVQINNQTDLHNQCRVVVNSYNGWVLLAGQAPTAAMKQQIESIANNVSGIKRLYNEIEIRPVISHSARMQDEWITTKVKSTLLGHQGFKSAEINVTTENGIVYLQGIVTQQQGEKSAVLASDVSGVRKVVKLFEYAPNQ
ncbi:MAG: BON domain-containing protein [Pseudomonadota bacterium]